MSQKNSNSKKYRTKSYILDAMDFIINGPNDDEEKEMAKRKIIGVVNLFTGCIMKSLSRGYAVKIKGFGTFTPCERKPKVGRNPKTNTVIAIGPRKYVKFKHSPLIFR